MNEQLIFKAGVDFGGSLGEFKKVQAEFIRTRRLEFELRDALKDYRKELRGIANDPSLGRQSKEYGELSEKIIRAEQDLKQVRTTQRGLNKEFDRLKLPIDSTARMRKEVAKLDATLSKHVRGVTITAKEYDLLEKQVKQGRAEIGKLNNRIGKSSGIFSPLNNGLKNLKSNIATAFTIGAISDFVFRTGALINRFDENLKVTSSITRTTGKDLEDLADRAIELGDQLKASATGIADAFALIGSKKPELLGNADALEEVTKQSVILSKAIGTTVPEAAEILTGALNQYGAGSERAAEFADVLATSQQRGTARATQLSESLRNVGAVANAANLSFEDTNALLQALAKGNIDGAQAGTQLRGVISKLAKTNRDDLNPSTQSFNDILSILSSEVTDITKAQQIFGEENAAAALTLIEQRQVVEELTGSLNEVGNALEQAKTNTDTVKGASEDFTTSWESLVLSVENGSGKISGFFKKILRDSSSIVTAIRLFNDGNINSFQEFLDVSGGSLERRQQVVDRILEQQRKAQEEQNIIDNRRARGLGSSDSLDEQIRLRQSAIAQTRKEIEAFQDRTKENKDYQLALQDLAELQKSLNGLTAQQAKDNERAATTTDNLKNRQKELQAEIENARLRGEPYAKQLEEYQSITKRLNNATSIFNKTLKEQKENNLFTDLKKQVEDLNKELAKAQTPQDYLNILNQILAVEDQITGIGQDIVGRAIGDQSTIDLNTLEGAGSDTGIIDGLNNQATGILQINPLEDPELLRQKALEEASLEQQKAFLEAQKKQAKANQDQQLLDLEQFDNQRQNIIGNSIQELGKVTADFLTSQDKDLKEFAKSVVVLALDTLEKLLNVQIAQATIISLGQPDSIATFGASGIIRANIIGALIKAAFAVAKNSIGKLEKGGSIKLGVPEGGRSHAQGGNKKIIGGNAIETERGEVFDVDETGNLAVINKISSRLFGSELKQIAGLRFPGKRALLSGINSFKGFGVSFPKAANGALVPSFPKSFSVPTFSPPNTIVMQNGGLVAGGNTTTDPDNSELRKLLAENNQLMREQINATKELMSEDIPEQSTQRTF